MINQTNSLGQLIDSLEPDKRATIEVAFAKDPSVRKKLQENLERKQLAHTAEDWRQIFVDEYTYLTEYAKEHPDQ